MSINHDTESYVLLSAVTPDWNEEGVKLINEAQECIKNGDYITATSKTEEAINKFKKGLSNDDNNEVVKVNLEVAYQMLATEKNKIGVDLLNEVQEKTTEPSPKERLDFRSIPKWNIGIKEEVPIDYSIKISNIEKAIILFKEASEIDYQNGVYRENLGVANQMLQNIKREPILEINEEGVNILNECKEEYNTYIKSCAIIKEFEKIMPSQKLSAEQLEMIVDACNTGKVSIEEMEMIMDAGNTGKISYEELRMILYAYSTKKISLQGVKMIVDAYYSKTSSLKDKLCNNISNAIGNFNSALNKEPLNETFKNNKKLAESMLSELVKPPRNATNFLKIIKEQFYKYF
jgi:tetratricopeptide (TPR) repeat protein